MTPDERQLTLARGRQCLDWLTDDELVQHVGMLEVIVVQRQAAAGAADKAEAHLVAALLEVRAECEAEQKLSVLHYPTRLAVACSRCGRELPDGNGVSSHGVGGLYCGERCISAQEASIPPARDTIPSAK